MNEWISVKDRYPDSQEVGDYPWNLYLCTDGKNFELMAYFGLYKGTPEWSSPNFNNLDVTHWMELPKLPK